MSVYVIIYQTLVNFNIMILDLTIENFGPFLEPISLSFEASKDPHLEPAYVRSFKFKNGKILRLLRAAIIYGPNGAGKSSILDALSLIDSLVTKGKSETTSPIDVKSFAFQDDADLQPTKFCIRFIRNLNIYRYQLQITKTAVVFEKLDILKTPPSGRAYALLYERKMIVESEKVEIKTLELLTLNKSQVEKLEAELQGNTTVLYTLNRKMRVDNIYVKEAFEFLNEQLMGEVTPITDLKDWVSNRLENNSDLVRYVAQKLNEVGIPIMGLQIDKKPLTEWQLAYLEKESDENKKKSLLEVFDHEKNVSTQYQVGKKYYLLNLKQESLGTQRYYEVAGLLSVLCKASFSDEIDQSTLPGNVLPLDELEHSLHPELIKQFLVTFLQSKGNSQLITTTHYRELLQDKLLFRDDVIWFVDKDHETMSSSLYCLEDVKTNAGIRSTSSVYNYYVQGRLGATPQLNNNYE